ncbi:MAG: hemolysin family protein [Parachlamydiales bacterium]|jgi:CBS domain containing-hemolysin-like protein
MIVISLLLLLLLFLAFLAAAETAFFSLSPFTLRSYKLETDGRKKLIARLLDNPKELLVTLLILNIFAGILIQNTFSDLVGAEAGLLWKVGLPMVLTLVLGEIIPKTLALSNNKAISYKSARLIFALYYFLAPLRRAFTKITSAISRLLFFFLKKEKTLSAEELKYLLKTSSVTGVLNQQEKKLIAGYLDLKEATVRQKMHPKEELVFFDLKNHPLEKLPVFFESHALLPIVEGGMDNLLGILALADYFAFFYQDSSKTASDLKVLLKKPLFIPEWSSAYELLLKLKAEDESLAIVVNEYGSISGLITLNDLLQEIIGRIEDIKEQKPLYYQPSLDVVIASAKLELKEFFELFGEDLSHHSSAVTLGGFLTQKMQEIPSAGTKYTAHGFLFYVLEAEPTKLKTIYVKRLHA